ncbi:MAG: hypothetical protein LC750_18385 [Actinobacteria bacterium]|nr:hypothetical protein [Actinomycetota bacterium]
MAAALTYQGVAATAEGLQGHGPAWDPSSVLKQVDQAFPEVDPQTCIVATLDHSEGEQEGDPDFVATFEPISSGDADAGWVQIPFDLPSVGGGTSNSPDQSSLSDAPLSDDCASCNSTCEGQAVTKKGTDGKDNITGNYYNSNSISAGDGDDSVFDGSVNDWLCGNADDDLLGGSAGIDTMNGGSENDTMTGGDGADVMYGGSWSDLAVLGDAGNDTIEGGMGNDSLYGKAGADVISGNEDADSLFDGKGSDTLHGGSSNHDVWFKCIDPDVDHPDGIEVIQLPSQPNNPQQWC